MSIDMNDVQNYFFSFFCTLEEPETDIEKIKEQIKDKFPFCDDSIKEGE